MQAPAKFVPCIALIALSFMSLIPRDAVVAQDADAVCNAFGPVAFTIEESIPVEVEQGQPVAAKDAVPAYCSVTGVVAPQVGFTIRLPLEGWNGRFLQQGCGGMCGVFKIEAADDALMRGYAVATTDMGHRAASTRSGIWAYQNPSARKDFWYRATHVSAVAAKHVLAEYYGRPPTRSIHRGCGTGGRAGLIEAQRFPDDFDGVLVTGGSVLNFVRNNLSIFWNIRASRDPNGGPMLSRAELGLVHRAVLAECATDGSGIIANPLTCDFDPASLACPMGDTRYGANCLTPQKVATVQKFYDGPRNSDGEQIYAGQARGSELAWVRSFFEPSFVEAFVTQLYSYLVLAEPLGPDFQADRIDFSRPMENLREVDAMGASDGIDYDRFKARNGKLLMAYGWNESSMPGPHASGYFDRVARANGGVEAAQEFFRLFMVPGNFACVGGSPARQEIDLLSALETWLETGKPPHRLLATAKPGNSEAPATTRPLFPYPSWATYSGQGDPGEAASYVESRPR